MAWPTLPTAQSQKLLQGGALVLTGYMTYDAHPEFLSLSFGLVLMMAGLALRLTVKSYPLPVLADVFPFGPYRFMRHPSMTGTALVLMGAAVATRSSWGMLAIFVVGAAMLPSLLNAELALERRFGPAYRSYRLSTTRLFPSLFPLPSASPIPTSSFLTAFIRPKLGEWKWWVLALLNYAVWCLMSYKPEWRPWSLVPAGCFAAVGVGQALVVLMRLLRRRTV